MSNSTFNFRHYVYNTGHEILNVNDYLYLREVKKVTSARKRFECIFKYGDGRRCRASATLLRSELGLYVRLGPFHHKHKPCSEIEINQYKDPCYFDGDQKKMCSTPYTCCNPDSSTNKDLNEAGPSGINLKSNTNRTDTEIYPSTTYPEQKSFENVVGKDVVENKKFFDSCLPSFIAIDEMPPRNNIEPESPETNRESPSLTLEQLLGADDSSPEVLDLCLNPEPIFSLEEDSMQKN